LVKMILKIEVQVKFIDVAFAIKLLIGNTQVRFLLKWNGKVTEKFEILAKT